MIWTFVLMQIERNTAISLGKDVRHFITDTDSVTKSEKGGESENL